MKIREILEVIKDTADVPDKKQSMNDKVLKYVYEDGRNV